MHDAALKSPFGNEFGSPVSPELQTGRGKKAAIPRSIHLEHGNSSTAGHQEQGQDSQVNGAHRHDRLPGPGLEEYHDPINV